MVEAVPCTPFTPISAALLQASTGDRIVLLDGTPQTDALVKNEERYFTYRTGGASSSITITATPAVSGPRSKCSLSLTPLPFALSLVN